MTQKNSCFFPNWASTRVCNDSKEQLFFPKLGSNSYRVGKLGRIMLVRSKGEISQKEKWKLAAWGQNNNNNNNNENYVLGLNGINI